MSFELMHQINKPLDGKASTNVKPLSRHDKNLISHSNYSVDFLKPIIDNHEVRRSTHSARFDFARIGIQPKLKASQPGDEYEEEADKIADQVISMPTSNPASPITAIKEEEISRQCLDCEVEEEDQKMEIGRKPSAMSDLEASDQVTNEINSILSSSSSALDHSTRQFMKTRFGHGFTNVRVH